MARSIAAPGPRRLVRRPVWPAVGVPHPLKGAANLTRAGIAAVWRRRRLRIALLSVLALLALAGGGLLLVRHSPLSAVEHVQIEGLVAVHGADSGAIEAALTNAAHEMSTLAVKPAALQAAVASYPIVRSVRAHAKFPHGLRIEVIEQPPVAQIAVDGVHTAVAADGVVLGQSYLSSSLPLVDAAKAEVARTLPAVGRSVHGGSLLQALTVLGAAPPALERAVTNVYSGSKGLTIVLRGDLLAYFGDDTRPHAKWIALTRVLADPSSAGAAYIDVRLPERPAAGFAPGTSRPDTSSAESEPSSVSDPNTAAELAAGLDAAVSGSSTPASTSSGAGAGSGSGSEPAPTGSTSSSEPGSSAPGSPDSSESEATG
jgi:cell division protein FtsQ